MSKIKILIIAPKETLRKSLCSHISSCDQLEVVGSVCGLDDGASIVLGGCVDVVLFSDGLETTCGFKIFSAALRQTNTGCVSVSSAFGGVIEYKDEQSYAAPVGKTASSFRQALTNSLGKQCFRNADRDMSVAGRDKVVMIGASTGGIEALLKVLENYSTVCPPTLIVQHIGAAFANSLTQRLDRNCNATVRLVHHGIELRPGNVYIAPGNSHHLRVSRGARTCLLVAGPPRSGHRPSVDELFESGSHLGQRAIGVLLTGMGRDGAEGLLKIRQQGGATIAQDAATSTVFGMPRVAFELGAVDQQLPIESIGPRILQLADASPEVRSSAQT